jgi:poly(A) polymerase/tRNA nucleotidyltransferase (CCA-adding enzyme)
MSSNKTDSARLAEFGERLKKIIHKETALSLKDLAVNGRDLMEAGIPGGPVLGTVLEQLLETVLDDPEMNTKERLLPLAKNLYGQIG